jgi:hypothetical protein
MRPHTHRPANDKGSQPRTGWLVQYSPSHQPSIACNIASGAAAASSITVCNPYRPLMSPQPISCSASAQARLRCRPFNLPSRASAHGSGREHSHILSRSRVMIAPDRVGEGLELVKLSIHVRPELNMNWQLHSR